MMSLTLKRVLLAVFSLVLITSCKKDKDKDDSGSYPKQVTVEYKVSSSTGAASTTISYTNESGGQNDVDDAALPFSKKFTATVERYDFLSITGYTPVAGSVKYEILVNDKVVSTKTFSGTSGFAGSITYGFN